MKVDKKGRLKLEKNEYELDNYVLEDGKDYFRVSDKAGMMHGQINSIFFGCGMGLKMLLRSMKEGAEGAKEYLRRYCLMIHMVLTTLLDVESIMKIIEICTEAIKKRPGIYGIDPNKSEEEDAKDLESVKNLHEMAEEIEKIES